MGKFCFKNFVIYDVAERTMVVLPPRPTLSSNPVEILLRHAGNNKRKSQKWAGWRIRYYENWKSLSKARASREITDDTDLNDTEEQS
ncbi:MAG: hypothetical protein DMG65_06765 [Candidatus Angelobacter sp. Gp1-AA117]|nr:MAG: hypothetical protein DMG65_06765 [Candidatus Angelobacter sp. Gp1-AA117]